MKDEYKRELAKIKAPRELIERTKLAMAEELAKSTEIPRTEEKVSPVKKKQTVVKINFRRRALLSAALLLIIVGSVGYIRNQTNISIQAIENKAISLNPNLGQLPEEGKINHEAIKSISSTAEGIIPDFLKEVTVSKIKGHTIRIAIDEQGVYHAGYQRDDTYVYVRGEAITKEEMIDYLKKVF